MSLTGARVQTPDAVHYPEGDGKPMAETDVHRDLMVYFIEALKGWFRGQDVYVSGNLLLYYEEGNPRRSISPDVLVAFGLSPERRRTYKTWEEGKAPDLVIEVTSDSTRSEDRRRKPDLYLRLGVRELWLVDPLRDYLKTPIVGYQAIGGEWAPLPVSGTTGHSPLLGLDFGVTSEGVRLIEPGGGRILAGFEELAEQLDAAERRAADAHRRLDETDRELERQADEIAALRAELERLRGGANGKNP